MKYVYNQESLKSSYCQNNNSRNEDEYENNGNCNIVNEKLSARNSNLVRNIKQENNKADRIRAIYKMCVGKKERIFDSSVIVPSTTLELIDKFRTILNNMLDDEEGVYLKEEILNVSRELDDMIYYYYKTSKISK